MRMIWGIMASLALSGCATYPKMSAAWYFSYTSQRADASDASSPPTREADGGEGVDDIYVAIVNRGRRNAPISQIYLNSDLQHAYDVNWNLASGGVKVLKTGLFQSKNPQDKCTIPLRLWVRPTPQSRRLRLIMVRGSIPTLLPDEWRPSDGSPGCGS